MKILNSNSSRTYNLLDGKKIFIKKGNNSFVEDSIYNKLQEDPAFVTDFRKKYVYWVENKDTEETVAKDFPNKIKSQKRDDGVKNGV